MKQNTLNHLISSLKRKLDPDEAFVTLREEFGFRYWFWFPEMSKKELVNFWKSQKTIDNWTFRRVFPGTFILAEGGYYGKKGSWHEGKHAIGYGKVFKEDDEHNEGDILYHEYYNAPLMDLWDKLDNHSDAWYAHVFDTTDSILVTKNPRRIIWSKGKHAAELQLEKDIKEQHENNQR